MPTLSVVCLVTTADNFEDATPANSLMVVKAEGDSARDWKIFWRGQQVNSARVVANSAAAAIVELDGDRVEVGNPFGKPVIYDGQRLTTPDYLAFPPAMEVAYDPATRTIDLASSAG